MSINNVNSYLTGVKGVLSIAGTLVALVVFIYAAHDRGITNSERLDKIEIKVEESDSTIHDIKTDIALIKQSSARQEELLKEIARKQ